MMDVVMEAAATTPFKHLVDLHVRLLELRASVSSEVSAGEDAASFGDPLLSEQHFRNADLYRNQVKDISADIQKQFDSAPELRRMSEAIEGEARVRYGSAS